MIEESYQRQSFSSRLSENWGAETSNFRIAVYTTFFQDSEVQKLRNHIVKARTRMSESAVYEKEYEVKIDDSFGI